MTTFLYKLLLCLSLIFVFASECLADVTEQEIQVYQDAQATLVDKTISPMITKLMEKDDIAGVAVVIVKDGKVLFKHGYGFADVTAQTPVDPDTSLFHIGSVTKLFTATAAMQLYEQGKLDLSVSVNEYLTNMKVEEPFGRSITMADLLTHRGGLRYKLLGTVTPFGQVSSPLGEHLPEVLPSAARTPGFVSIYSDYGIALEGRVIEEISGESYQDYVENHIFKPLEMKNSGTILTPERSLKMAMPGASIEGTFPPEEFNYSNFAPATEVHASVTDMAKFMLMQLGHEGGSTVQILKPKTRELMQSRQYSPHSSAFGWGYGFREDKINGHLTVGHDGSWFNHLGKLTLVPEQDLGIYVVMNQRSKAIMHNTTQAVIDIFLPQVENLLPTGNEQPTSTPLTQFSGTYLRGQFDATEVEKLKLLAEQHKIFDVTVDGNALIIKGQRYYEMEPNFFLSEDGHTNAVFVRDPYNNDLYITFNGSSGHIRVSWFQKLSSQLIFSLLALFGLVLATFIQMRKGSHPRSLKTINFVFLTTSVVFIPVVFAIMLQGQAIGLHIATPLWVEAVFNIPWFLVACLLLSITLTFKYRAQTNLIVQLCFVVSAIIYLAVMANWNLL
ncbi:serine hydrolase domain-containing protein [Paraglaciecola sp.]|uniref:serine hydrolase domain-containing protein n=1 Tax=Paraglaciecola sp. TaxID=1920173 RepID=UPI0032630812